MGAFTGKKEPKWIGMSTQHWNKECMVETNKTEKKWPRVIDGETNGR